MKKEENLPIAYNDHEIMKTESAAPEPAKESRWEKIKSVISNREMQKQALKTTVGTTASIVGLKSLYDVPAYFRQRFMVRGMFGAGKGMGGSIEEVMVASQKLHEKIKEDKKAEKEPIETEEVDTGIFKPIIKEKEERVSVRESLADLNKRLAMTKEGSEKGSEQRNLVAKLLRENRINEKNSHEERSEKITEILDDYTTTKVTGMQAARESLNSFCVASGAITLRGAAYGIMDGVERYQKLSKGAKKKGESVSIFKDVIVGGIKETLREAAGKSEEKGRIRKSLKAVSAWGKVARYAGMAATAEWHPEAMEKDFDKVLDALEGKVSLGDANENFMANLDRITHSKTFSGDSARDHAGHGIDQAVMGAPGGPMASAPGGEANIPHETQPEAHDLLRPRVSTEEFKTPLDYEHEAQTAEAELYNIKGAPEISKFIEENVEVKSGDSIWSVAKKYLGGNEEFNKLGGDDANKAEALRTYNIDMVKRAILADPKKFGIPEGVDINKLSVEQLKGIKWQEAFDSAFKEKVLETDLSEKQIENIVGNNKSLRDFFSEHPKAPRTQENYEAILRGRGETGEIIAAPEKDSRETQSEQGDDTVKENIVDGEKDKLTEEVLKTEAGARTNARVEKIYQWKFGPFKGSQIEEWNTMQEKSAHDILAGKFGEPIHGELDAAQMHNQEELQAYVNEAKTVIGEPEAGETVKHFCERYESSLIKEAHATDNELSQAGEKGADKIDYIPSGERTKIIADYRGAVKGLENEADKINLIKVIHYPKDSEALSKLIGGVNNNIFEGSPRAAMNEKGDLIVSFNVKDNAVDANLIITKNGKIAVDGYMKNNWPSGTNVDNPTRDFNKQSLGEAMAFLNKGKFWNELDGKINYEDANASLENTGVIKNAALVVEEPPVNPEMQPNTVSDHMENPEKDVLVEPIIKESSSEETMVEPIIGKPGSLESNYDEAAILKGERMIENKITKESLENFLKQSQEPGAVYLEFKSGAQIMVDKGPVTTQAVKYALEKLNSQEKK